MSLNPPTTNEWQQLYAAAAQIKALAPWEWMREDDVFGVQNPETGDLGFVSVMGALGEHHAVAVYLGAESLYRFWALHQAGPQMRPEAILEIPQLQASFEDRNTLTDKDRKVKKELGLKFRGRQAWPMFRSFRPGYLPWYIETDEARFLAIALEQLGDVAPRLRESPDMLATDDDEKYLVRVPTAAENGSAWRDEIRRVPTPKSPTLRIPMNEDALDYLAQLPLSKMTLEIDFFWTPIQVQEKRGERPSFAYNLMIVDSKSGFVLGTDVTTVADSSSLEDMYAQLPVRIVIKLDNAGFVPQQVNVQSPVVQQLVGLLGQELGFEVRLVNYLPMLEEAKAFLLDRFR